MKNLCLLTAAAAALSLAPRAARADSKFGYVDLQRALNEVEEGKSAKALLKREMDTKQKAINDKEADLKKQKDDLEKQRVVMAPEAVKDKEAALDRQLMEFQMMYVNFQKELNQRENDMTRPIFDKMYGIIKEIAEAEGFTMVFDRPSAGIVYAPVALDLTNELIRKYNSKYKAGDGGKKKADAAGAKGGKK